VEDNDQIWWSYLLDAEDDVTETNRGGQSYSLRRCHNEGVAVCFRQSWRIRQTHKRERRLSPPSDPRHFVPDNKEFSITNGRFSFGKRQEYLYYAQPWESESAPELEIRYDTHSPIHFWYPADLEIK